MPVKNGDRRGPYKGRATTSTGWSAEDEQHFRDLIAESPLGNPRTKENAARRATELSRQLAVLDSRPRTVDEEKALISASGQYRRWLEVLKVSEAVARRKRDDEDEDDD